jgi:CheY-like chemotaxis protein
MPESRFDLRGLRVLVVDDESDARELVKRVLTTHGCEVTCAETADLALALFAADAFDLLVSDIGMPQLDGYAFIRHWRKREHDGGLKKLPAIALTAYARADDRRKALMSGFNAHLAKPVDAAEMITIVASLTDRILGDVS